MLFIIRMSPVKHQIRHLIFMIYLYLILDFLYICIYYLHPVTPTMPRFIKCAIAIFFIISPGYGHGEILLKNMNSSNSTLSSDIVYKLVKDKHGYIWLLTSKGLMMHDGKEFISIKVPLYDQEIVYLSKYGDYLWLCNYAGRIACLDLDKHTFLDVSPVNNLLKKYNNTLPITNVLLVNDTLFMSPQRQYNTFYVTSKLHGGMIELQQIPNDAFKQKLDSKKDSDVLSLLNYHTTSLVSLKLKDNIIIIRNKIFEKIGSNITTLYDGNDYGITESIFGYTRLHNDLYINFYDKKGLIKYENYFAGDKSSINTTSYLEEYNINDTEADNNGNIWIATYGKGVFVMPATSNSAYTETPNNEITYLELDDHKRITGYSNGVVRFDINGQKKEIYLARHLKLNYIDDIAYMPNACIVKTKTYTYYRQGVTGPFTLIQNKSKFISIKDIEKKDSGYCLTYKTGLKILDNNGTISELTKSNHVNLNSISLSAKGDTAYGTTSGLFINNTKIKGLENDRINKVRYKGNDLLICGISGFYVRRNGSNIKIKNSPEINDVSFTNIKEDSLYYYAYNNTAVSVVDKKSLEEKYFFCAENFYIPIVINCLEPYRDSIYIGTNNGLVCFPKTFFSRQITPPPVYMHYLHNQDISGLNDSLSMPYSDQMFIQLRADVLNYMGAKSNLTYRIYKNEKPVTDEIQMNSNMLNINNLSPGNYKVVTNATSLQEKWNKSSYFYIRIIPLWYQTIWFYIATCVLLFGASFLVYSLFYNRKMRKLHVSFQTEMKINKLESQVYLSQIKPHFVFNALNPLQSFILKNKKNEALQYLDKFSTLLRGLLTQNRNSDTNIRDEITFLESYLRVQNLRFENKFTYHIQVDERIDPKTTYIPTMLLQPLVENAIEHGFNNVKNNCYLSIHFSKDTQKEVLYITIENTGNRFDEHFTPKNNHALKIIQERIELKKKQTNTGSITFGNNASQNAEVKISLPVIKTIKTTTHDQIQSNNSG